MKSALIIGVVFALGAPPLAHGDRIAVVATSGAESPAAASRLRDRFKSVLESLQHEVILDPFAVAAARVEAGAVPAERLASFGRARDLSNEGWRSYLQVRYEFAASRLAAARQEAEHVLDLDGGTELYAEISIRLGAVKLELGRGSEAAEDFRIAHVLAPDRVVSDDEFKRSVVEAHQSAIAARRGGLRRSIVARVAGATIEVDGKSVGPSPVEVDVEPGLHAIVVRAPGHAPSAQVAAFREGDSPSIELTASPDPLREVVRAGPARLSPGTREEQASIAAAAVFTYTELDGLLLAAVVWRRGTPALLGQYCTGVPVRCGRVVELGFDDAGHLGAAAAEMWRLVSTRETKRAFPPLLLSDVRLTDAERGPGASTKHAVGPWWKSPWLWVGATSVAVAVTGAVLLSRDRAISPVVEVQPCDFGVCQ